LPRMDVVPSPHRRIPARFSEICSGWGESGPYWCTALPFLRCYPQPQRLQPAPTLFACPMPTPHAHNTPLLLAPLRPPPRRPQGYKQELKRGLSGFHNFAVSFTVVSVLTGLTGLYGNGLTYGGPVAVTWGWVLVSFFTLLVALRWGEAGGWPAGGWSAGGVGKQACGRGKRAGRRGHRAGGWLACTLTYARARCIGAPHQVTSEGQASAVPQTC